MACQLVLIINNNLVIIIPIVNANIQEVLCLINPLTLFGWCKIDRNVDLLETLHYKKRPPRVDPGGHSFVFLNVSINKKPVFFSEVVINKKAIFRFKSPNIR